MPPYLRNPSSSPTLSVVGDVYRFLATGEDTGAQCTIIDAIVGPGGGPPPHTHTREDEHFIILEGEITFLISGREQIARPGDYIFAPRGHAHTFSNRTARPARMLLNIIPAGIERMFFEVGTPLANGATSAPPPTPESIKTLIAAAPRYGITLHL